MTKWPTYIDRRRGPVGAKARVEAFQKALVERLLGAVWTAYDVLLATEFSQVNWSQNLRDLERSLSQRFELQLSEEVRKLDGGYLPVRVQHGSFEHATQSGNVGQPPAYDIAFVWVDDHRIMWPLEAKALRDDQDSEQGPGEYVKNGVSRYLNRRYAPYTTSGAMIAYLRTGAPDIVLKHIARRLNTQLMDYQPLPTRPHRLSIHSRPTSDSHGSEQFVCHHLVLCLSKSPSTTAPLL